MKNFHRSMLILALAMAGIIGCGPTQSVPIGDPVNVTGSVTSGGKPVGNVTLNLQPLENGYPKIIPVGADGSFSVETQPGRYAFFFSPKEGAKSVPPSVTSYAQANMEHTVTVQSGQPISIALK